jgi:hypothetical protein
MSNKAEQYSENIRPLFSSFRRENLLSCFAALCQAKTLTRAELACATELSIMTTGKIADAMIEGGILNEEKHPCTGAGRRPGSLRFSNRDSFLILKVSSRRFTAHVITPSMSCKEICIYDYNDIFPFDDNLLIFLNAVRRGYHTTTDSVSYLAVITAPQQDNRQSITRALTIAPHTTRHMIDYIEKIMRRSVDLVTDEITAAQHYFNSLSLCRDVGCGAFINLSDMTYAAVWMKGNLQKPRICRIGELMMPKQKRIADALADAVKTEDAAAPAAYAIGSLEAFFTPDCVMIESNKFRINEDFLQSVYKELAHILPADNRVILLQQVLADPCAAVCGCACELRRTWFCDLTGVG